MDGLWRKHFLQGAQLPSSMKWGLCMTVLGCQDRRRRANKEVTGTVLASLKVLRRGEGQDKLVLSPPLL